MTRILWLGDAADSGFGTVTASIGKRLLAMGHDVRFIMQNETWWPASDPDIKLRSGNINLLPGNEMLRLLTFGFPDGWQPESIVLLADYGQAVQTIMRYGSEVMEAFKKNNVFHYVPIEGRDLSPAWGRLWEFITPIAMSEFGADQIELVTGKRPEVIYHGVDREVFHPLPYSLPEVIHSSGLAMQKAETFETKREAKRRFGLNPDHIILLRTDRYMPRKHYNAMLRSLAPLLAERADVDLVIHCSTNDQAGIMEDEVHKLVPVDPGRFNRAELNERFPNRKALDHIQFTKKHDTFRGIPTPLLALMYAAADIYINSGSEGFGLCLAESIACGTPVVGMDYSAVPEVVGPAGILYPYSHEYDNTYNHYWAAPDESALREAVTQLVDDPALRQRLGSLGPAQVERFDWDMAAAQFAKVCAQPQAKAA